MQNISNHHLTLREIQSKTMMRHLSTIIRMAVFSKSTHTTARTQNRNLAHTLLAMHWKTPYGLFIFFIQLSTCPASGPGTPLLSSFLGVCGDIHTNTTHRYLQKLNEYLVEPVITNVSFLRVTPTVCRLLFKELNKCTALRSRFKQGRRDDSAVRSTGCSSFLSSIPSTHMHAHKHL